MQRWSHRWARLAQSSAVTSISSWQREPEWPLYYAACCLGASFVVHATGYCLARCGVVFAPPIWEGRTGWRKPMLFGISNALVFVALRAALRSQRLVQRSAAAHAAAWSTLVEVGIITLQAWRDEPSHFNMKTPLDALLYALKLAGVTVLGVLCLAATAGCLLRPSICGPQLEALRCGMSLLSYAVAVGFVQVVYGHSLLSGSITMDAAAESECRHVTAGASGAPCYEVYGLARLKILHFVPLHSTESLLALAWVVQHAGLTEGHAVATVRVAAVGHLLVTLGSTWQAAKGSALSLRGIARLELQTPAAVATVFGLLAILCAFGRAGVAAAASRAE